MDNILKSFYCLVEFPHFPYVERLDLLYYFTKLSPICKIKVHPRKFPKLLYIFKMKLFPLNLNSHFVVRVSNIAINLFPKKGSDFRNMSILYDRLRIKFMKVKVENNNILFLGTKMVLLYALFLKI